MTSSKESTQGVAGKKQDGESRIMAAMRSSMQQLFAFAGLIVVYVCFLIFAPNFSDPEVIPSILMQTAAIGVMALGATFVIATAGIDLSVGTGMSLCAVCAGLFMSTDYMNLPLGVGVLLTILVGCLLGFVNGFNVAILGIPPFIATLAMMMVARGLALILSKTESIQIHNPYFYQMSNGEIIPNIANAALIFIILTAVAAVVLNKTLIGRYALSIGSNEEATRLSGINVKKWLIVIYMVAGIFTAIGGLLYSARFGFSQPAEGMGMELQAIAAVVIGGTSLAGGRANIIGTLIGALLMNTLVMGLQMMGVLQQWQLLITGLVVLLAVFGDNVRRNRAAKAL